jgi:hypothetical protein
MRAAGIIPDPDIKIGSIKMWSEAVVSELFRVEPQKQPRTAEARRGAAVHKDKSSRR